MGRIAEALRKAQRDREEQLRVGLDELASVDAAALPDLPEEQETPATVPAIGTLEIGDSGGRSLPSSNRISRAYAGLASHGGDIIRGLRSRVAPRKSPEPPSVPPAWDVDPALVCLQDRWSSLAEQYRAIRTWLLRRNISGEHTALAITSSMPREGKTVTTANLAVSLAELRHLNILAVDCDLRSASLAKLFRLPKAPGFADVLAGRNTLAEALRETPLANLTILSAGLLQNQNPAVLLNSPITAKVFDEIRERYHYILVDTPPVQKLTDVGVVGALCSGILLVVRMHRTPSNLVRQSLHWLQSNSLSVIGCIAAACNVKDARHLYRESYAEKD
jgi:capsular exopolysaccharide synthesis family protein